jgi:hypothetical protein
MTATFFDIKGVETQQTWGPFWLLLVSSIWWAAGYIYLIITLTLLTCFFNTHNLDLPGVHRGKSFLIFLQKHF